ncbi:MAG: acyl-CoA thioesterase [Emcibacter sp.]|nr:acyl-CoA thioesterase [Emcibacter sp.]
MQDLFIYKRQIQFGDTDAVGIVYTVRFFDYCMEAIDAWQREYLNIDWFDMVDKRQIGTPMVNINMNMTGPLARGKAHITLLITHVGKSSVIFRLLGRDEDDNECFEANFTYCLTDCTYFKPIPIPEQFRPIMESYHKLCLEMALAA